MFFHKSLLLLTYNHFAMKQKVFLCLALLLTVGFNFIHAQTDKLSGTWVLEGLRNEPFEDFKRISVGNKTIKTFDNNSFIIEWVSDDTSVISTQGTYKILSDTTFSELVTMRYNNANENQDIILNYKIEGDVLYTSFYLPEDGNGKKFKHFQQEMWRKVNDSEE